MEIGAKRLRRFAGRAEPQRRGRVIGGYDDVARPLVHLAVHVADADELESDHASWVRGKASIGITGGTSTPEVDLEEVRDRIYALTAA